MSTALVRHMLGAVLGAVVLASAVPAAHATFPGRNGVIAYQAAEDIWTLDPLSGAQRQTIADGRLPAWSASGRRLAFVRAGGIWIARADGSDQIQLTSGQDPLVDSAPAWAPDGTRIAFTRGGDLWVVHVDGGGASLLATDAVEPAWSPDGQRIAFRGASGVWTMRADGSDPRLVAPAIQLDPATDGTWVPAQPDWSPDGRQLVAQYTLNAPCDGCFLLYRFPADGGPPTLVADTPAGAPSWSPDGRQIVGHAIEGLKLFDLTGGWRFLLVGAFFDAAFPAWQPLPVRCVKDRTAAPGRRGRGHACGWAHRPSGG